MIALVISLRGATAALDAADYDASGFLDRLDRGSEVRLRAHVADLDLPQAPDSGTPGVDAENESRTIWNLLEPKGLYPMRDSARRIQDRRDPLAASSVDEAIVPLLFKAN
jgi:hypothetical protein